MDPNAADTYAYRHLHVAGRGGRRADSTKGGTTAGFIDKRPNTSHKAAKGHPSPLLAEPLPPKPHTAHTSTRNADVLPGGKDVTPAAQIEKERAAAAAAVAATKSPKKTQNAAKAANEASKNTAETKIAAFRFGRLDGRPALLAHFVFTYFHPLPEYRKIVQELDTPTKQRGAVSCLALAQEDVDRQGRRIQARGPLVPSLLCSSPRTCRLPGPPFLLPPYPVPHTHRRFATTGGGCVS